MYVGMIGDIMLGYGEYKRCNVESTRGCRALKLMYMSKEDAMRTEMYLKTSERTLKLINLRDDFSDKERLTQLDGEVAEWFKAPHC